MSNRSLMVEDLEAQYLINLSFVVNTEKKYLKFDDKEELDIFLSLFLSWLTKKD
ncbi:7081_t:CDS:2, partial [Scutellospora calospora]